METKTQKTEEQEAATPARRREMLDKLKDCIEEAQGGDKEAISRLRELLKEGPRLARIFSDLANIAEHSLLKRIVGDDPVVREALPAQLKAMREEIAGSDPSPLEKLLAERIVACWLQLYYADAIYTESGCILLSMSEKRNTEQSESSRLESLYRKATDPVLRTHLLMVWRISLGDSIPKVAEMVGYSQKWVTEIARRYNSDGVEGLGDRRHTNPGGKERALLDEEGQACLHQALLKEARPGGGMWSGPKVARWIEQRTGIQKVHNQRGWEYLRKVGYSPQVP